MNWIHCCLIVFILFPIGMFIYIELISWVYDLIVDEEEEE